MCFVTTIICFNELKIYLLTLETIHFSAHGYLENVTDSRCAIVNLELVDCWVPNLRLNLLGNS